MAIMIDDPALEARLERVAARRELPVQRYVRDVLDELLHSDDALSGEPGGKVVREGRLLVVEGNLPPGYDLMKILEDERAERDRRLLGL